MSDNPYINLVNALKDEEEDELSNIGTVVSVNPLKVKIGDLIIDRDNLVTNRNITRFERNDELYIEREGQHFIILAKLVKI